MKFTKKQLENFDEYEELRQSGIVNMFAGREHTSMDKEEYMFCIKNYGELKKQYDSK